MKKLMPITVILLWGSATVLSALSLREIGPMAVAFWRWVWALPILWAAMLFSENRMSVFSVLRSHFLSIIAVSISGIVALYGLQNLALGRTSVFNVSLLIELTPVFIALLGIPVLHEYPRLRTWIGIALGFFGAVLLGINAMPTVRIHGSNTNTGEVLALGAALSGALYTIHGKRLMQKISPLILVTLSSTAGVLMLLPIVLWENNFFPQSLTVWSYLIVLGFGAGALGNLWWFSELKNRPAAQLSIVLFITALVAAGLAVIVLGDPLTPWLLVGGALVLVGARLAK